MADTELRLPTLQKPKRPFARCETDPHRFCITRRGRERFGGCIATLFSSMWTGGTLFALGGAFVQPSYVTCYFATVFSLIWIGCCLWVLESLFGVEKLEIADGWLHYSKRIVGISARDLWVRLTKLRSIDVESQSQTDGPPLCFLEIRTGGRPFHAFEYLDKSELEWWRAQLKSFVTQSSSVVRLPDTQRGLCEVDWQPRAYHAIVSLTAEPISRPEETDYILDQDLLAFRFSRRARWSLSSIFSLVVVSIVFFGGGVLMTQGMSADGGPNVLLLLLVAPLILIFGFVFTRLFQNLAAALVGPARRIVWEFEQQAIVERLTWFGIGRLHTHIIGSLAGLEIYNRPPGAGTPFNASTAGVIYGHLQSTTHVLAFRDADGLLAGAITDLTEDEAHWIGDCVLRARPSWFDPTQ